MRCATKVAWPWNALAVRCVTSRCLRNWPSKYGGIQQ
jgi:hypothetical protein